MTDDELRANAANLRRAVIATGLTMQGAMLGMQQLGRAIERTQNEWERMLDASGRAVCTEERYD